MFGHKVFSAGYRHILVKLRQSGVCFPSAYLESNKLSVILPGTLKQTDFAYKVGVFPQARDGLRALQGGRDGGNRNDQKMC